MLTFLLEQVVEITLIENGYMYHLMETALNELGFVMSTFEVVGSDHGDAQARVRLMISAEKKCLRDAVGPVAPPAVGVHRRLVARDVLTPAEDIDKGSASRWEVSAVCRTHARKQQATETRLLKIRYFWKLLTSVLDELLPVHYPSAG